jgi:hypothetical protein
MEASNWVTAVREHSGQKLAIRLRPCDAVSDARCRFHQLLVVTHQFSSVTADGMPEESYNSSLFNFDCDLIRQLEIDGRVVLVETYAAKRIYYAYVADESASRNRAAEVLSKYGHSSACTFRGGADPAWRFYTQYCGGILREKGGRDSNGT